MRGINAKNGDFMRHETDKNGKKRVRTCKKTCENARKNIPKRALVMHGLFLTEHEMCDSRDGILHVPHEKCGNG